MAIFHLHTNPLGRSSGHSAVAAAAYRAGVRLIDERTGEVHDYRRKGGVLHAEIVTPAGVPVPSRSDLWNAVESAEKRKDARVAREWRVALPHELGEKDRIDLARRMGRAIAERFGVAVDICIHAPDKGGDDRNYHAHLLATTRRIGIDGTLGAKAAIEMANKDRQKAGIPGTSQDDISDIRRQWAEMANEALARAGIEQRIDHRSYADQGLSVTPTRHIGRAAVAMARRGLKADRFEMYRADREKAERERLEAERKAREARERAQRERAERERAERERAERERQRLERMSSRELAQEIDRLRPPPVRDLVERDHAVVEAERQRRALGERYLAAQKREAMARREAEQWRRAHPMRAKAHDAGLIRAAYLDERARIEAEARHEWQAVAPRIEEAALRVRQARERAEKRITCEQAPIRAKVAELEAMQKEKAEQERLEAERKAREARERAEQEARERLERWEALEQATLRIGRELEVSVGALIAHLAHETDMDKVDELLAAGRSIDEVARDLAAAAARAEAERWEAELREAEREAMEEEHEAPEDGGEPDGPGW